LKTRGGLEPATLTASKRAEALFVVMAFSLVKYRVNYVIEAGAQSVGKDGIKAVKKTSSNGLLLYGQGKLKARFFC
jgi:hypothetical protein